MKLSPSHHDHDFFLNYVLISQIGFQNVGAILESVAQINEGVCMKGNDMQILKTNLQNEYIIFKKNRSW